MGKRKKNHQKRTTAGHEHIQLKEEHRLQDFSPDLTVTKTFAPIAELASSAGKDRKPAVSYLPQRVSDFHLNRKNPSQTGVTPVVVLTAALPGLRAAWQH